MTKVDLKRIERELETIDFEEMTTLHLLVATYKNQRSIMSNIQQLQDAVDGLVAVEHEAAEQLQSLTQEVASLTAGTISQEQIDSLTSKVTDVTGALTSAVDSSKDTTPEVPTSTDDDGTVPPPTSGALPLYVVDDGTPVDPAVWPSTGLTTPDGRTLYHYSGDTPGGSATGDDPSGTWHVYTGDTVPVPS